MCLTVDSGGGALLLCGQSLEVELKEVEVPEVPEVEVAMVTKFDAVP